MISDLLRWRLRNTPCVSSCELSARDAQAIPDANLLDDRYGRKEDPGSTKILKSLPHQGLDDEKLLERGIELIEGLYHSPAK